MSVDLNENQLRKHCNGIISRRSVTDKISVQQTCRPVTIRRVFLKNDYRIIRTIRNVKKSSEFFIASRLTFVVLDENSRLCTCCTIVQLLFERNAQIGYGVNRTLFSLKNTINE